MQVLRRYIFFHAVLSFRGSGSQILRWTNARAVRLFVMCYDRYGTFLPVRHCVSQCLRHLFPLWHSAFSFRPAIV